MPHRPARCACVWAYFSSRYSPEVIGAYLGGLSFEHEDGRLATTQSKFGSKKNGIEYRSAPMRFTTRWIVDTNRSFDQRCSMA